jgi:hypothetical protein
MMMSFASLCGCWRSGLPAPWSEEWAFCGQKSNELSGYAILTLSLTWA